MMFDFLSLSIKPEHLGVISKKNLIWIPFSIWSVFVIFQKVKKNSYVEERKDLSYCDTISLKNPKESHRSMLVLKQSLGLLGNKNYLCK